MNRFAFLLWPVFMMATVAVAQSKSDVGQNLDEYAGRYLARIDSAAQIIIRKEKRGLILHLVGQGEMAMVPIGPDKFRPGHVRPKTVVEFVRDNSGKLVHLKWIQPLPPGGLHRIASPLVDSMANASTHELSKYVGNYQLSRSAYRGAQIRIDNNQLTIHFTGEGKLSMKHESGNRFFIEDGSMRITYDFVPDATGKINHINFSRTGGVVFVKSEKPVTLQSEVVYGFNRPNGFTRADTLRGKLSTLRSCYDVLFYDLNVRVYPDTRSVSGSNIIRFKTVEDFNQMQIDLFSNMQIENIYFHDKPLSFVREHHAVFVQFPQQLERGTSHEIMVVYSGKPQKPDGASLAGGIFWLQDKEGNEWIETVTQGSGASLWWPCKDHLSDKPDSMRIRVTVPKGLTDISNGRLRKKSELPDGSTQFDWYVSYPITTYCVAMNIGTYVRITDQLIRDRDTLQLVYYSKPYDIKSGSSLFKTVKPMLTVFEKYFGKYPFSRDGFTVMESIYPMEHQGAVTFGSLFNPFNSDRYDSVSTLRTLWHEAAHEWWGNHVTVKDYADLWIHEAFATYAEVLATKEIHGDREATQYLKEQVPGNHEPILGKYDVNDFHLGDMYSKGVLMLYTLQNVINNDALWFDLLRDIQIHFAHQTITTNDLVNYINQKTNTDFSYFFDQYLKFSSIPELRLKFEKQGKETIVKYRWHADVANFTMPIRVTNSENSYMFIYPTREWKAFNLKTMKAKEFRVDTGHFYVAVRVVKED